ncbi:hypothetical protein QNO07_25700 [Streptomyces sp. 549]|uniref:hypothetical protein n=1 Tax=Streptomyces sp. 549 TaxID=3049076 RepID=UPI0024C43D89|nr:hypothetical protein [Streptomyces sp. 549]MDK1476755.1 hypothetical protein [Streptomyces sp. 549]
MGDWWQRDILDTGKLPLTLALLAFLTTFLLTRTVTRLIRAGHGPFRNVSSGGVHVHHVVPGVVLMVVGGFGGFAAGIGTPDASAVAYATALVFGTGAGLVLDEFALVLHLSDVYWSENGRKSVEAVVLTSALLGLLLLGFAPFGTDGLTEDERGDRTAVLGTVAFHVCCSLVALAKGKFRMAVLGVLVPLVSLVGAVRLARPGSPWARRLYRRRPRARAAARRRATRHDARWGVLRRRFDDAVAGAPDRD